MKELAYGVGGQIARHSCGLDLILSDSAEKSFSPRSSAPQDRSWECVTRKGLAAPRRCERRWHLVRGVTALKGGMALLR